MEPREERRGRIQLGTDSAEAFAITRTGSKTSARQVDLEFQDELYLHVLQPLGMV